MPMNLWQAVYTTVRILWNALCDLVASDNCGQELLYRFVTISARKVRTKRMACAGIPRTHCVDIVRVCFSASGTRLDLFESSVLENISSISNYKFNQHCFVNILFLSSNTRQRIQCIIRVIISFTATRSSLSNNIK